MALPKWDPKDPNDIADYWFDWGSTDLAVDDRFLPEDLTITTAVVTVADESDQPTPSAPFDFLTIASQSFTTKKVRTRFAGGIPPSYPVNCVINTDDGQRFEITKTLAVKERTK